MLFCFCIVFFIICWTISESFFLLRIIQIDNFVLGIEEMEYFPVPIAVGLTLIRPFLCRKCRLGYWFRPTRDKTSLNKARDNVIRSTVKWGLNENSMQKLHLRYRLQTAPTSSSLPIKVILMTEPAFSPQRTLQEPSQRFSKMFKTTKIYTKVKHKSMKTDRTTIIKHTDGNKTKYVT